MRGFRQEIEPAQLVWLECAADDGVFAGLDGAGFGAAAAAAVVFAVDDDVSGADGADAEAVAVDELEVHVQGVVVGFEQEADGSLVGDFDGELGVGGVGRTVGVAASGVFLPCAVYACAVRVALGRFLEGERCIAPGAQREDEFDWWEFLLSWYESYWLSWLAVLKFE